MSHLDQMAKKITFQRVIRFNNLQSFCVVLLGIVAFIIVSFFGYALANTAPDLFNRTNEVGLTRDAVMLWSICGFFAILVWYFGNVTLSCNAILRERWF